MLISSKISYDPVTKPINRTKKKTPYKLYEIIIKI